ncbi:MAG: flavin reductase [Micromonosporaceae bacterium]|nr:flavin reductase [Micromonosporaceae bacterium]
MRVTIHGTDPFATPEPDRSPVRRFRSRLVAPVTLWTAPGPAGLTVSSMLVADGDPGRVLGLVDDESDLWEALSAAGRFAVCPLLAGEHQLADRFAGLAPAPGGRFRQDRWRETEYGPVPAGDRSWAGCRLDGARPYGWGLLVEGTVVELAVGGGDAHPLGHYRGRYRALDK